MDKRAWQAAVHGVEKSWTQLSDFTFTFHYTQNVPVVELKDAERGKEIITFLLMIWPHMYGCESWTVKKAERRRIDAFELWCWRRLLRVP